MISFFVCLGVIACPISSGDTAFRSARLTIADALKLEEKSHKNRLLLTLPLLSLGVLVSQLDYTSIWNYFASTNQILAAIVLWTAAMYLRRTGKKGYICALPAAFMTAVTLSFVLNSKLYLGCISFFPPISKFVGFGIAALLLVLFVAKAPKAKKLTSNRCLDRKDNHLCLFRRKPSLKQLCRRRFCVLIKNNVPVMKISVLEKRCCM